MNPTFDRLSSQLRRATFGMFWATLFVFAVTLLCALLGLSHAVATFRGVTASLAYVFVGLLSVFLIGSLVAAIIRWVDRRNQLKGSGSV
jgi:ABC-type polysaccharide/polyol phosphate export permease